MQKSTPRPSAVSAYTTTGMKAINGPEGKFANQNSGPPRNEFRAWLAGFIITGIFFLMKLNSTSSFQG